MVGTASSGPWCQGDRVGQNARGPHRTRSDKGKSNPNRGQWGGNVVVKAVPASGQHFTWERVASTQCIEGTTYTMGSSEHAYFEGLAGEILDKVRPLNYDADAPGIKLLYEINDAINMETIDMTLSIQYGQLQFRRGPHDISLRENKDPSYVPEEEWETYPAPGAGKKPVTMAQAPVTLGTTIRNT